MVVAVTGRAGGVGEEKPEDGWSLFFISNCD